MRLVHKFSDWEFEADDNVQLQKMLYFCICEQCKAENGLTEISELELLFGTLCGAEFHVE